MNLARGFLFAGLHAGIKPQRKDLALVFSPTACAAAACVTANAAKAAPCADAEQRLPAPAMHAVLINSGNANALTGPQGLKDVATVAAATATALGVPPTSVLMASTGVIGVRLPKEKIIAALPALKAQLTPAPEPAAEAILTTDTRIKIASRVFKLHGKEVTITAICKGSGMIAPQLATMIAVICTDANITAPMLHAALKGCMDSSFNNLTVDDDMSTNDVVFALANGLAGNKPIADPGRDFTAFASALQSLCEELAKEIAADGEGATRVMECLVTGAPTKAVARDIAKSICGSSLVKAAVFGADPNWGRVLATVGARAGSQGFAITPSEARVHIQGLCVYDKKPVLEEPERLANRMREPEVKIEVELRAGREHATAWGCDLSYDYVKLNADYTSLVKTAPDGSVLKDNRFTNYSPAFKVTLLTQALGYIDRFADKRCVVKLGGAGLAKDTLTAQFCADINLLRSVGMVPVVVHSEGTEWKTTLQRLGIQNVLNAPASAEMLDVREMVVDGATNSDLVSLLNRSGGHAVGMSGKDGALLRAIPRAQLMPGPVQVAAVDKVNTELLEMFLSRGYVPVISPVGIGPAGESLPLDADEVAAAVAGALKAAKLVYVTGAPGLLEADQLLPQLTTTMVEQKLAAGSFTDGSKEKAQHILKAISEGVGQCHVIDGRTPHAIIAELFTDQGVGTLVTRG